MFNVEESLVSKYFSSELFLPEEQKIVAGLCYTWNWISSFAVGKVFLYLVEMFGLTNIFLSISVLLVLNMVFTVLAIPETRKKKDEESIKLLKYVITIKH